VKVLSGALVLVVAAGLSACSPSPASNAVNFGTSGATNYLAGGEYAVSVANECGATVKTVVAQIDRGDWTYPLLNGTPVSIPQSGSYKVLDPIGNDLMFDTPACELAITVALTPVKG
jgi:hypothetical protein